MPGRKNPKDLTRQEFADKLDSVFQDATRDSAAQILKLSVFQELHENEEPHMHAAMQVLEPIRHTRLFRTLREKHGIFIHLEDGRRTYWGIVAYLAVPSESKPDVDASPWLSKGHPPVGNSLTTSWPTRFRTSPSQNRAGARILFQALQGHSDAAGNRVGHPSVHG